MATKPKIIGIIPARYASSRFPGKPLASIHGKPMIQWVYEAALDTCDHLVIATDDTRIADEASDFNARVMLTSPHHKSGTERCLEVVEALEKTGEHFDIALNIQGDEPLLKQEQLKELIRCLLPDDVQIASLAKPFSEDEDPQDPNRVKVILNAAQNALYFSRSAIPFYRNEVLSGESAYLKHIGLYGFKTEILKKICNLPEGKLERAESLEQLRWLEYGFTIRMGITEYDSIGIDTPGDLEKLLSTLNKES